MSSSPEFKHSANDLLAYEPFIRSIARRLIADENRVADVVQETWLRALTKAPREGGSLRAWLGSMARNLALDEHRRDGSRRERERDAARDESVSEDECDLEMHGKLVEAVLSLDEPYKGIVILRYFRGLSSARIAKKLDRNAATVRSQLHRSHELLKEKLDRKFGGDRSAWVALCVPLAAKASASGGLALALKAAAALIVVGTVATALNWIPLSEETRPEDSVLATLEVADEAQATRSDANSAPMTVNSERRALIEQSNSVLVTLDGTPVEGADVWFLPLSEIDQEVVKLDPLLGSDPTRLFPMFGTLTHSDAFGRAPIRSSNGDFAVFAVKGQYLTVLTIADTKEPVLEARLEQTASIVVRVVDVLGNPVPDVPVVLRETERTPYGFSSHDPLTRSTSGPAGLVEFRAFDWRHARDGKTSWSVRLGVPGVPSRQTSLDLDSVQSEPLTLLLDSTGSLVVRTLDEQGKPLAVQGTAHLRSVGLEQATMDLPLVDGVARFPRVGVGSELEARVSVPLLGATWVARGRGPKLAAGNATIEVHRSHAPALTGRVLDLDGSPLVGQELLLYLLNEERNQVRSEAIQTDEKGRFRCEVTGLAPHSWVRVMLVHYSGRGVSARAETPGTVQLGKDETRVGDLMLFEAPGWMEGRVVSADGTPVAEVGLRAKQVMGSVPAFAESDEHGHFGIGGLFPEQPEITLDRSSEWVLASPAFARRGQTDLELVLVPGGSIAGAVLVNEALNPSRIEVAVYDEERPDLPLVKSSSCDAGAGYELLGLPTGLYRLSFALDGTRLAALDRVSVRASEACNDPRVELVDLRRGMRTLELRVVDALGETISRARAQLLAGGERIGEARSGKDGMLHLSMSEAVDGSLYLDAPGMRGVFVPLADATGNIVLEPGILVELQSSTLLDLRAGETTYFLSLQRIEDDPELAQLERSIRLPSSFAKHGSALVRFPAPGRYRLKSDVHYGGELKGGASESTADLIVEIEDGSVVVSRGLELPSKLPD